MITGIEAARLCVMRESRKLKKTPHGVWVNKRGENVGTWESSLMLGTATPFETLVLYLRLNEASPSPYAKGIIEGMLESYEKANPGHIASTGIGAAFILKNIVAR